MLLRWRQTGRANHKAADGQGGYYTIDRWLPSPQRDRCVADQLHPGWLAGRSVHPTCKVEWEPGVEHTLQMTKASAQHDLDERMKLTAEEAADN